MLTAATLTPNTSTKKIYRRAFALLRKEATPAAARYSLKRSVMNLGPTGYPFERLWGRVLETRGFESQVGVTLRGMHVAHEIDVDARRGQERVLCECKFHRRCGRKSDGQISAGAMSYSKIERLYCSSRNRCYNDARSAVEETCNR